MDKEQVLKHYNQKWGFGMAPLKSETEQIYKEAVYRLYKILTNLEYEDNTIEDISVFKGLINRCVRQDQWDWFTVYTKLGEPDPLELKLIPPQLTNLRKGINNSNKKEVEKSRENLLKLSILDLCEYFLGIRHVGNEDNEYGYVYILSRREQLDILKIGMTNRSVEQRVKEINSATGVLFPYSVRRIFKVKDAKLSEKLIFKKLAYCRVRADREFFIINFKEAVRLINCVLIDNEMFI